MIFSLPSRTPSENPLFIRAKSSAVIPRRPSARDIMRLPVGILALLVGLPLLAACSDGEVRLASNAPETSATLVEVTRETLPVATGFGGYSAETSLPPAKVSEYKIGSGDLVAVFVFDHPELSVPLADGERTGGFLVQADGTFSYPFVGSVRAEGRTVAQIRTELAERLANFIPNPQVDVRVVGYNSQRVVIGGEVRNPSTLPVTSKEITLLEAINSAGGLTDRADASNVVIRRNQKSYSVDLQSFLLAKTQSNNPIVIGGDVISVPRQKEREIYVFGEIVKPSAIPITDEPPSVTQAIAKVGGLEQVRADATAVLVFRLVDGRTTVYKLDLTTPDGLILGSRFRLVENDVVYVSRSQIQRWNDTISRILPTLGVVNTVRE